MANSFVLTTNLLGWRHAEPITQEAFNEAGVAVDRLLACLAIEEAYAVLIDNYVSFEKAVAIAKIENMVERGVAEVELHERRREIDRHLVNLLAAGQMFSDHVFARTKRQFRRSNELAILEVAIQRERDRLIGFWATECLRDAVLHNALPITSWTTGGQWVGAESPDGSYSKLNPGARLEYAVSFAFRPDLLARDRKADPVLIARLKDRADKAGNVSWVPIIRQYVEGLSMLLADVRGVWSELEVGASGLLREMTDAYRAALPTHAKPPIYVLAVEKSEDGTWLQQVLLNVQLERRLSDFRRKHRPMVNLHLRSLTG